MYLLTSIFYETNLYVNEQRITAKEKRNENP